MSSSLGFFTLAQKKGIEEECEAIGQLKHILTKEYKALKNETAHEIVRNKFYRLEDPESSFAEVLHVFAKDNTVTSRDIVNALHSGSILIPQMEQTNDTANDSGATKLPRNWQIRFLYHQLKDFFQHEHSSACSSCLKALRLMQMRTPDEEARYFAASDRAFQHWKLKGTEPLQHPDVLRDAKKEEISTSNEAVSPKGCTGVSLLEVLDSFLTPTPISEEKKAEPKPESVTELDDDDDKSVWSVDSIVETVDELLTPVPEASDRFEHGILLFTDVDNSTHHFQPNFLPPYGGKRKIILDIIQTRTGKPKAIRKLTKAKSTLPGVIRCDHTSVQYSSEEDSSLKPQSKQSSGSKGTTSSSRSGKLRSKFTKLFQPKTVEATLDEK